MKNYDLNIWDRRAYMTDYKHTGKWRIDAFELALGEDGYYWQTDPGTPVATLRLTPRQVELMGLSDDEPDFWSDALYLLDDPTYHKLPRRVKHWLEKLVK